MRTVLSKEDITNSTVLLLLAPTATVAMQSPQLARYAVVKDLVIVNILVMDVACFITVP